MAAAQEAAGLAAAAQVAAVLKATAPEDEQKGRVRRNEFKRLVMASGSSGKILKR